MVAHVKEYIDEGLVKIIGGCCGTTEAYIRQVFRNLLNMFNPRRCACSETGLSLAFRAGTVGKLHPEINFVNVGERWDALRFHDKFLRLINEKKYDEALSIARKQAEDGALM